MAKSVAMSALAITKGGLKALSLRNHKLGGEQFVQSETASLQQKRGRNSLSCFRLHYAFRFDAGVRAQGQITVIPA